MQPRQNLFFLETANFFGLFKMLFWGNIFPRTWSVQQGAATWGRHFPIAAPITDIFTYRMSKAPISRGFERRRRKLKRSDTVRPRKLSPAPYADRIFIYALNFEVIRKNWANDEARIDLKIATIEKISTCKLWKCKDGKVAKNYRKPWKLDTDRKLNLSFTNKLR